MFDRFLARLKQAETFFAHRNNDKSVIHYAYNNVISRCAIPLPLEEVAKILEFHKATRHGDLILLNTGGPETAFAIKLNSINGFGTCRVEEGSVSLYPNTPTDTRGEYQCVLLDATRAPTNYMSFKTSLSNGAEGVALLVPFDIEPIQRGWNVAHEKVAMATTPQRPFNFRPTQGPKLH